MKLISLIILAALLAIVIAPFLHAGAARKTNAVRTRRLLTFRSGASLFCGGLRENFASANVETATGTHGVLTRRADAAHSATHLLIKSGTDAFHGAVCGAANYPIGSTTDSPDAAEDIFQVAPLNRGMETRRLRCATALAADSDVFTAAGGFVQAEPGTAGTFWKVGRTVALAVQEGGGNYVVEVATHAPVQLTVAATPSTVGNIATALATPGLVKFL